MTALKGDLDKCMGIRALSGFYRIIRGDLGSGGSPVHTLQIALCYKLKSVHSRDTAQADIRD